MEIKRKEVLPVTSAELHRVVQEGALERLKEIPAVYPGYPVPLAWKRLVQLKVENPRLDNHEASKILGVNHATVCLWQKKFSYQQYENWVLQNLPPEKTSLIQQEQRDALVRVREKYETYLDDMQERLMHILETTGSEKLQVEIIQDIHDRVGFVTKKDAPRATPIMITEGAMRELLTRAREAGLTVPADVIDAEQVA